jgi:NAD(P)-dependent dehydrogenase (short-subunit alcohol dehydrogenase family)
MNVRTSGEDRIALVTGAARGIGQAIAVRLAADGHRLALADVLPMDETVLAIKSADGQATAYTCDLAVDPGRLAADVLADFGRVDVLVNNAGVMRFLPFGSIGLDDLRSMQAVNVEAPFQLAQAVAPGMISRGWGRIINMASNTVWSPPGPEFVPYIITKGAIVGFTRALAVALGEHGITVNAIAPGLTRTPGSVADNAEAHFEHVRLAQPIKRSTVPGDLTGTVSYLASDDAAMVTGQVIRIDGGLVTLLTRDRSGSGPRRHAGRLRALAGRYWRESPVWHRGRTWSQRKVA